MTELELILDTMLPGDAALGLPSASRIGVDASLVPELMALVAEVSHRKFGAAFNTLDAANRLAALTGCKAVNVRLFSAFLTQVLRAYYTNPEVLRLVSAGSSPPFPAGNELGSDEWSLLQPVFERGPIYRDPNT